MLQGPELAQLRKELAQFCLLALIEKQERYGYTTWRGGWPRLGGNDLPATAQDVETGHGFGQVAADRRRASP